jgi:hypothetical protein
VSRITVHRRLISLRAAKPSAVKSVGKTRCILSKRTERYMVRLIRVHNLRTTAEVHTELKKEEHHVSHKTVLRKLQCIESLHFGRPRQRAHLGRLNRLSVYSGHLPRWQSVSTGQRCSLLTKRYGRVTARCDGEKYGTTCGMRHQSCCEKGP